MERREAPPTRDGWFALHDLRTIDWDAWRDAPDRAREAVLAEGQDFLASAEAVEDAEAGETATYSVTGHKADLLLVHLRETVEALNALERRFEGTALASVTERTGSYVSLTEASGYTTEELDPEEIEDPGLANYIETRLYPSIPEADYVCFYPMDKRRDPEQNWYDLPFEERAEHMQNHGEIGREYAGEVTQMITGSIGLDDWEWGVTLWSGDPAKFKDLLYEMRFDPSTSRFADFGQFYTGRRLDPGALEAFFAGESLAESGDGAGELASRDGVESAGSTAEGGSTAGTDADIRGELADMDIYAGKPHGEDVYAMVLYSEADGDELLEEVRGIRANFDHYDTHVKTAVYADGGGERSAVVSIWETKKAAETAGGFLTDFPEVVARAGEESGFGTMGMFYQVKSDRREDFREKFDAVGDRLEELGGHLDTRLLANVEDDDDMFIASQWESRDDAMAFFRSEEFADTVDWGREVLADRPRHVFLA